VAKSTGIVLAAGGISFANDWWNSKQPNFRIPPATLGVAILFAGLERLNERAAVGLATIMMITVLFTPMNGKSPMQTLAEVGKGSTEPKPIQTLSPK
jgi:hypothetical protein